MIAWLLAGAVADPFEVTEPVWVRAAPDADAPRRGRLEPGSPFEARGTTDGVGCDDQWHVLDAGGFACSTWSVRATGVVGAHRSVRFDPPTPEEYDDYNEHGRYDRSPEGEDLALPFVYGRITRRWRGPVYASVAAWRSGADPTGTLPKGVKAHFVDVVWSDPEGEVPVLGLVRPSGEVVPANGVYLYPISRFEGRDLAVDPVAPGGHAAWVLPYDGLDLRDAPDDGAAGVGHLPFQTAIDVFGDGEWLQDPQGSWLRADQVRVWRPAPPPEDLPPDALWIDVDLSEQTLAIVSAGRARFITLVSSGLRRSPTPAGLYSVTDKVIHHDMRSRPGSKSPYHVEQVPWIAHFRPRYALHGVFWHWGFGHPASHGCINLSPRDARTVFSHLRPILPGGWHSVYADEAHPGTPIRIRGATPR